MELIIKEEDLINKREERDKLLGNVEVLSKVKDLLLLGDTDFATTQQVTDYYEVGIEAIKSIVKRHKEELYSNGMEVLEGDELKEFKRNLQSEPTLKEGKVQDEPALSKIRFSSKLTLFSKRAILNVGMLLTGSDVAEEVRRRLLDITQDVLEGKEVTKESIIDEMDKMKQIQMDIVQAMMDGDIERESLLKTQLIGEQNKRIVKLENEKEQIVTHALTISDSRKVLNIIVRNIVSVLRQPYGKVWNDFYKHLNYKLGINIKARVRNENVKPLDTLSEEEMFKAEHIAKCWATELGIDLDKIVELGA